ncbi:MAG TPA: cobaltochelatase subunit CobN [Pseudomonas sp.]|nr:cobaltochelatase subunit CobN [Pseudomonadales bacterium]HCL40013.1 cobaltochelatase subunit CobN [Pseudomonas sp.]|tara:strand:+ start:5341 stop:9216 length:3876 start_codon:yes stop_codon:yes gene_type:complete
MRRHALVRSSLCTLLWLLAAAVQAQGASVLVLHNNFVSSEKFQLLQRLTTDNNVQLRQLNVEQADGNAVQQAIGASTLIVLDVPRPGDRAQVSAAISQLEITQPTLTIGGGRPLWEHLPPRLAGPLVALYAAGGEANFARFFSLTAAIQQGDAISPELLAPPEALPATGFYHPQAPQLFSSLGDYLAWADQRQPAAKGRIAFLIHSGMVSDMLTRELDELIKRSESAGLQPVMFWFDGNAENGLTELFAGQPIDALVNLTHMQNGSARSADFLALDVPVIQTLRFREGEAADWPEAVSGVAARTTAVFLAGPEGWGVSDPLVLSATTNGVDDLLPAQADALIAKLQRLVALRHTPAADKQLALLFWNYPAGEKNLGASNLNVPRSIVSIQQALLAEGYQVGEPVSEQQVIDHAQRLLGALYGSVTPEQLLAEGLAVSYPVAEYQQWLDSLPAERQSALAAQGPPAQHPAVRKINGEPAFVLPAWQLGHLLLMPQMPRGGEPGNYHSSDSTPDHRYLAAYRYLQTRAGTDALIHLGTHGTQEWLPGKDRGLAADDYPWLAAGDLPIVYPYIQDNVGEAIQAKRRGRAVVVSHQTPPFAPAGLYDQMRDLHHLLHEYAQLDEGQVLETVREQIRASAIKANMHADLSWSEEQTAADFDGFLHALHDHLHELARTAMPLGLHTFGHPASAEHRTITLMQQLGTPFYTALGTDQLELFAVEHEALPDTPAYRAAQQLLDEQLSADLSPEVAAFADRARQLDQQLRDTDENEALLAALAGRFVAPGSGGDPIRNPDVRSGRNLYAFEADKIPARAAWDRGATAYQQLVDAFRAEHDGAWPEKLAFSLWSSEAIRHLGVTEAQVLHALGLRPVWDDGGRVTALEVIPTSELGRPRSDVVVQVTGVYRDQFDHFMRLLDDAIARLAELDEPGNPIAANNRRIAAELQAQGMSAAQATEAARYRIFGNAPGEYGTGVPDLAMASTEWDDDAVLAEQFLASNGYAFGSQRWGEASGTTNLLASQLRDTQAAIMSRSSNLHGVLSTDHPFEFLGGLSAAVRQLDGAAPQLLISDLRSSDTRTTGLDRFLADELRVRYLNPQWIEGMQAEGYAGTLEVLNVTNNLFGWQAMDPSTVRDDQWQALFDTYVNDSRELGTRDWFEQHNPTAQAQMLERMAEAIRKDYWDASEQTRAQLAERWQQLQDEFDVAPGNPVTSAFIAELARGAGLETPASKEPSAALPEQPAAASEAAATQSVQGQVLEAVGEEPEPDYTAYWALALMLLLISGGALQQARRTPPYDNF